jgi:hypothetical protein
MAGRVSQKLNDVIMVAEEILGQTEDHGLRKINTREIRVSSEGIIRSDRIIQALSGRTIRALSDLLYGLNQVWASGPIQLNLDPTIYNKRRDSNLVELKEGIWPANATAISGDFSGKPKNDKSGHWVLNACFMYKIYLSFFFFK